MAEAAPRRLDGLTHFFALLIYAGCTTVFLDRCRPLGGTVLGQGADPFVFLWFFAWWPWAVLHHAPLLHTGLVWQPLGAPLLWLTSVPLLALLAAPLTLLAGPAVSLNLFMLAAPVLAAWAAFALCLALTRDVAAALIGGFLFGFSAYELGADTATLNLAFTALVPCMVLLAVQRVRGRVGRTVCVALAGLMMLCQFLISAEIFATACLFAVLAWLAALRTVPAARPGLIALGMDAVLAGAVAGLVLSPLLAAMLATRGYLALPPKWPYIFSSNLLNFFIPTPTAALGGAAAQPISQYFHGGVQEADAYLGLPLIAILLLYARENWRRPGGAFLLLCFVLFVVLSLGPRLWIGGFYTPVLLPWVAFLHLPLISAALPGRFALYVALAAAAMAALWLAAAPGGRRRILRLSLGLAACFSLLPAAHPRMAAPDAAFFRAGHVQAVLGPQPRLLVLPFGGTGPSTYWQAESGFAYEQTGGYLGYPPAAMQHYAVVEQLFDKFELPGFGADLTEFCRDTGTQYVVAGPGMPAGLKAAVAALGWPARRVDDVTVYTVPANG